MDTRLLKYFLAVATTGNFTQAANQLHITQPTLSRQIQDLEESLNTKLFNRSRRRHFTLTKAGVLFEQRARDILALWDRTQNEIRTQEEKLTGSLSIGCVESTVSLLVAQCIEQFQELHPNVTFNIITADGDDLKPKLDQRIVDVAFLLEPIEAAKYNYVVLPSRESWGIYMRRDDPLARRGSLNVGDIYQLPLILPQRQIIRDDIEDVLKLDYSRLKTRGYINLANNAIPLIKSGKYYLLSISGLSQLRPDPLLTYVPLSPHRETGHVMAWRKNSTQPLATEKFIQFVVDQINQPVKK